jgi:hypothetical protein
LLPEQPPAIPAHTKAELEALLGADHINAPREAVRETYKVVRGCTENDVAGMAGFLAWGLPLRHLRDALVPAGWSADRAGNFETVINSTGDVAITSARGDEATGTEQMPSTSTDKGPRTKSAVSVNRDQMVLDPKVIGEASKVAFLHKGATTWFLLHHYDEDAQEIRLELAVPVEFTPVQVPKPGQDARGVATRFASRLVLEPILLDTPDLGDEDAQPEEEIDFPVNRRAL